MEFPDVRPDPDFRTHRWHWVERPHAANMGRMSDPVPALWEGGDWLMLGSPERYSPSRSATLRWRYLCPLHFTHDIDVLLQKMATVEHFQTGRINMLERALARRRRRASVFFICGILSAVVIIGAIRALY